MGGPARTEQRIDAKPRDWFWRCRVWDVLPADIGVSFLHPAAIDSGHHSLRLHGRHLGTCPFENPLDHLQYVRLGFVDWSGRERLHRSDGFHQQTRSSGRALADRSAGGWPATVPSGALDLDYDRGRTDADSAGDVLSSTSHHPHGRQPLLRTDSRHGTGARIGAHALLSLRSCTWGCLSICIRTRKQPPPRTTRLPQLPPGRERFPLVVVMHQFFHSSSGDGGAVDALVGAGLRRPRQTNIHPDVRGKRFPC